MGSPLWVSRAGYTTRLLIPDDAELPEYQEAIKDANYQEYLDMADDMLIRGNPLEYAQKHSFDLLVVVPSELKAWNTRKNKDHMIIDFAADIGAVRKKMSQDHTVHNMEFENGTRMVRVVQL
jgi:hypothetical protein